MAKNAEWCPQHGYPLPCYKCGMSKPDQSVLLTEVRAMIDDLVVQGYGRVHQVDKNTECAKQILAKTASIVRTDTIDKINKALEPAKLYLCWITEGDSPEPISYGLADEDGDEIDITILDTEAHIKALIKKIEYQFMKQGKDKLAIYREVWQELKTIHTSKKVGIDG